MGYHILSLFPRSASASNRTAVVLTGQSALVAQFDNLQKHPRLIKWVVAPEVPASLPQKLMPLLASSPRRQPLSICLDRASYHAFQLDAPAVERAEMAQALVWRVKDMVETPVTDILVDFVEIPATRATNQVLAIVSDQRLLKGLVDQVSASSCTLRVIDVPPFALQNLASRLDLADGGLALFNLSANGSLLTLGRKSAMYLARNMDVARTQFLDTLATGDADDVQALFERLALEIQRSLDYYESLFSDPPITQLRLLAYDDEMDAFASFCANNLPLEVHPLTLQSQLDLTVASELTVENAGDVFLALGSALWDESQI